MKKIFTFLTVLLIGLGLVACSKPKSEIEKLIEQAEKMTMDELYQKAYEESKNATLYGLGNSSRGKTAGASFVEMMKAKYPDYNKTIDWSQPKENTIFQMLDSDSKSASPQFSMTLIQDGAQIKSKMIDTGVLYNFVPKAWKEASGVDVKANGEPLTLQTLSKVFMFNNLEKGKEFKNVWHFVREGERPMFMGLQSEPIGFNALLMLTRDDYVAYVKEAFDALTPAEKTYWQPKVDALKAKAKELKLGANAEYSLAWIQAWVGQMNVMTDDGPICNELVKTTASGQSGLFVYSKLRSVQETEGVSKNNITIAAYQDGYKGFGGYAYKHYLQVTKKSPLPWTAMAFIAYMVTEKDGFNPWGKDIGGYSANPAVNQDHSKKGYNEAGTEILFPALNDKGYKWWIGTKAGEGRLIVEDHEYAAKVSFTVGAWIETLKGFK